MPLLLSLRRAKSYIKWLLAPYPDIFLPMYRLLAPQYILDKDKIISRDSDIVIEGFPRSGNTFAVVAFRLAQEQDVKIAHHLHIEAQVLMGVRWGIPVLVLIRNPLDAIASLKVRHPGLRIDHAFRAYIRFYSIIKKVADNVVFADFVETTKHFGEVIGRVNERFGTNFSVFEYTPDNLEMVFREIENLDKQIQDRRPDFVSSEDTVSRPSPQRESKKQLVKEQISSRRFAALRRDALSLYYEIRETYCGRSDTP